EKTQRLHLWLIPPAANLVLGLGRVGLMALLILRLFGGRRGLAASVRLGGGSPPAAAAVTAIVVALSLALAPGLARAEPLPSPELLNTLRERLLQRPDCHPKCAVLGRLTVDAVPDRLRLRFEAG